jgi:hypothetical protein
MKRILTGSFLIVALGGCGKAPPESVPVCFPAGESRGDLSPGEQKALAATQRGFQSRCSGSGTQCGFSSRINRDNEITVMVMFARLHGRPPQCTFAPGGHEFHIYSLDGEYIRTIPGY